MKETEKLFLSYKFHLHKCLLLSPDFEESLQVALGIDFSGQGTVLQQGKNCLELVTAFPTVTILPFESHYSDWKECQKYLITRPSLMYHHHHLLGHELLLQTKQISKACSSYLRMYLSIQPYIFTILLAIEHKQKRLFHFDEKNRLHTEVHFNFPLQLMPAMLVKRFLPAWPLLILPL